MPNLYIEMNSGVSGDMLSSALLDLKIVDVSFLEESLLKLGLGPIGIQEENLSVSGIMAKRITFDVPEDDPSWDPHGHGRTYQNILELLNKSHFDSSIKEKIQNIFLTLAKAEGKVHGVPYRDIHFHEVGSLDAICDVVSFCILTEVLEVQLIYSSPFLLGKGEVLCDHGRMPVPVPAVVEILSQTKSPFEQLNEETGELTTPTGCAIVSTMANQYTTPKGKYISVGYGTGQKVFANRPNLLRVSLFEAQSPFIERSDLLEEDQVMEVKTNLDDMSPEDVAFVQEALSNIGALDVWRESIGMKKNRMGILLSFLCYEEDMEKLCDYLLNNSSAIGYRYHSYLRKKLPRKRFKITVDNEIIIGKEVTLPNRKTKYKIEFDERKRLSEKWKLSLWEVDQKITNNISGNKVIGKKT